RGGRILFCDTLDRIKQSHARVTLRFELSRAAAPRLAGALTWEGSGRDWTAVYTGRPQALHDTALALGARVVNRSSLSLDEIFLARAAEQSEISATEPTEVSA